jgi:polar amino acid transport system substrate-binding protein
MTIRRRDALAGSLAFGAIMANPARASDASLLASTGTLRAVFLAVNPAQGRIDRATGAVSGPAAELTEALAKQLGIPFVITGGDVLNDVKAGKADIGFLAFDPVRAKEVDFSRTYLLAHNTYAVPAASDLRSVQDIDRAGVRIGVSLTDAGGYWLQRNLKAATLKGNPKGSDLAEAQRMFAAGEIDAYAANTQRLQDVFGKDPAFRVLPGAFYSVQQAIIVQKGRADRLAVIDRFLDQARASGLVAGAISRAGLVGVDPAPADLPR